MVILRALQIGAPPVNRLINRPVKKSPVTAMPIEKLAACEKERRKGMMGMMAPIEKEIKL